MNASQSFGIHFTIRADKEKDGKSPIYACITINRKKCFFALKQNTDSKSWDNRKGVGKGSKDEIRAINSYLENLREGIGQFIPADAIKRALYDAGSVKGRLF